MTAPFQAKRVVVLGGGGDLAMRYLAPAFAELVRRGDLAADSTFVGVGRDELDTGAYREEVRKALSDTGAPVALARQFEHARADATRTGELRPLLAGDAPPAVVYLALPPSVVPATFAALAGAGVAPSTVVAVEKPFGTDASSARALNRMIAERLEPSQVLRVDHFVAMRAERDLSAHRFASPVVERALEAASAVEITWDESLALEGRASYYDSAGAVVDMVQNHLLQVLAAIAMERPASTSAADVSRARLAVLRATRARERGLIRARYGRGRVGQSDIPAYANEAGVDAEKRTETFVHVELEVDAPRWRGIPFVVRTGKALARDVREVAVTLAPAHRLVIGLTDEGAYVEVLDALLRRDVSMFVSGDEVEAQWAIVDPVLDAFREDRVPLLEYAAGSGGPT